MQNEYNPNSDILTNTLPTFEVIFKIIQLYVNFLHKKYQELANGVELAIGHENFLLGLEATKELHDPINEECGL